MTIQHHPGDNTILALANGSLGQTLALALGAHLDGCEHCRQSLSLAESLGGLYLEAESPAELDARAYARVLELLDAPLDAPAQKPAQRFSNISIALPASLKHRLVGARRWLAPGIWVRPLLKDSSDGTRAYLIGAAPGKALPHHGHSGVEMTQVLQGEFSDGQTRYGSGDFLEAGSDVEHRLMVGGDQECICVIASHGIPSGLPGLMMRLFT